MLIYRASTLGDPIKIPSEITSLLPAFHQSSVRKKERKKNKKIKRKKERHLRIFAPYTDGPHRPIKRTRVNQSARSARVFTRVYTRGCKERGNGTCYESNGRCR